MKIFGIVLTFFILPPLSEFLDQPQINITHVNISELHFELDANPPANFEIIFESNSRNEPINKRVNAFKILHQDRLTLTRTSYLIRFAKLSEQEMGDYLIIARNSMNTTYGEFRLQSKQLPVILALSVFEM